jgi:hypothetical protein
MRRGESPGPDAAFIEGDKGDIGFRTVDHLLSWGEIVLISATARLMLRTRSEAVSNRSAVTRRGDRKGRFYRPVPACSPSRLNGDAIMF